MENLQFLNPVCFEWNWFKVFQVWKQWQVAFSSDFRGLPASASWRQLKNPFVCDEQTFVILFAVGLLCLALASVQKILESFSTDAYQRMVKNKFSPWSLLKNSWCRHQRRRRSSKKSFREQRLNPFIVWFWDTQEQTIVTNLQSQAFESGKIQKKFLF